MQAVRYGKSCGRNICSRRAKILKYSLITIFVIFCISCVLGFIVLPLVFMCSVDLERLLMFTNIGLSSDRKDYERPFSGMKNFYVTFQDRDNRSITLGVWHLVPLPFWNETDIDFDDLLANSDYDVVMHFHGSGETRTDSIGMFSVLYNFFHVIAFDYRDYGDSTPAELSEDAVSRDSIQLYEWVRRRTKKKNIYVWGHSLGTALGTLTLANLRDLNIVPAGLMLEAPLTKMREEVAVHPYGKLLAWLPWFESTVQNPLEQNGFRFDSAEYILKVDCPIMIVHAEDDSVIPYQLGKKLSELATFKRTSRQGKVIYHQFPKDCGYDHFRIFKAPELPDYIRYFIQVCEAHKNRRINKRHRIRPTIK